MSISELRLALDSLLTVECSITGNSKVKSLATYRSWQVATVTFIDVPNEFKDCKPGYQKLLYFPRFIMTDNKEQVDINRNNTYDQVSARVRIMIDYTFYGLTPLFQPGGATNEYE